jgi:FlaA1/EpsC-like NDP-sugar epimerase
MLPKLLLRFRRPMVLALHIALVPLAYRLAFELRFDRDVPPEANAMFYRTVGLLLIARLAAFAVFGLFRGWLRHAGMRDLMDLLKAVTISSILFLIALFATARLDGMPRSVPLLDWILAVLVFGGLRFAVRAVREQRLGLRPRPGEKSALFIGAGAAAERLLRDCQRHDASICPVGLLDDDANKRGMRLHGVTVFGAVADLPEVAARIQPALLVIAIPSATRAEMRQIVDACLRTGIEFKIVPSMRELLDGRARMGQLRNVQIEDLLGREVVRLTGQGPAADIRDSTVLVTGGAGSIGSELARQLARLNPRKLVIVDQAESPLYFIQMELAAASPALNLVALVADITDEARMEQVFRQHEPTYVFHAAAYKHVPLMEANAVEAVRNNVLATLSVATCAARVGTKRFILISTDKAVHPSSVMGATKRIAEQLVLGWPSLRESATDFRAVRFGNVLGSDGSVVPVFKRQLAEGRPLTVTHPDVTRYFMTIPEAVQLVLQAAALPEAAGRICMLDMGEPVKIVDLAENLIRLSGLEPYRDVPIVFTGLRPGEKLHEELMSNAECTVPTKVSKIRIVQSAEPDSVSLTAGLDRLAALNAVGTHRDVLDAICGLVPECVPPLRDRRLMAVEGD